ncbi:hypothetical protein AZH43_03925 [Acinetobacter pragensis]|uniref:Uncharacterized protein n=2 Tax=Acinetobacter pragensis TaxID=1806892 RepID=A0A151XXX7_9GAMM|nr:hypothetical protein AZH43_03925 [Acinetobacter pragensis]
MMKKYAEATPQDPLTEIFSNVYLLRGSIKIGPLLQMNRNMVIVRDGNELTLINAVRLDTKNLEKLDELGEVKNIIRLGDFHGLDDQFYIDQYKANFWSQESHSNYAELHPNKVINTTAKSPVQNSKFFIFASAKFPEAALFLEDHQLLITTDSIQYWNDWKHISFLSKIILSLMGFRLELFIGGPWLKRASRQKGSLEHDFNQLLALNFTSLVAAHGNVLKHSAKTELEKVVFEAFK